MSNNLKEITDFFVLKDNKYECLVADCKSKISTLTIPALFRHFKSCHKSKLCEIKAKNIPKTNLARLKQELIDICVEHVTVCGRPLSSVNDESFKKLAKLWLDKLENTPYQMFHTDIYANLHQNIFDLAELYRSRIGMEFENKYYSIMFDSATRHNRALLGINIQTIHEAKIVTRTIAMQQITSKHTGINIARMIHEILEKNNISIKYLVSSTVDNGSNMVKAVEELDRICSGAQDIHIDEDCDEDDSNGDEENNTDDLWTDPAFQLHLLNEAAKELSSTFKPILYEITECVRCAAHTIQLAINDALKKSECNVFIEKARDLVKKLRLQHVLLQIKSQKYPVPPLDCITRWLSTYTMVCIF